eukprot:UN14034
MAEIGKMLGEAWKTPVQPYYQSTKTASSFKRNYDIAVENINLQINAKNTLPFVKNTMQKKYRT